LAIFLDRITRKKEVFFSVYTIKGKKEIRRNQVAKKSFPDAKIDIPKGLPDKKLDSILKPRLQDFINNLGKKTGKTVYQRKKDTKSSETVLPPTDEHQLWRFVLKEFSDSFETGLSVNEIAEKWFRESPSAKQVQAIDEVLHESKSQGYGYFRYTDQKKFIPLSTSEYDSIKNNIKDIEKIRNRLVEKEEFEDDEGYIQVRYIPVGLKYATFSESDMEIVKQIQNWMAELIQTKTIKVGLGGTFIHTIDKFSLPQFLRFLAEDWTETRDLFQPDSAMVEFLLRTDYLEEDQALEILAKRAVRDYPNFSWDVDEEMQSIALGLPDPEDEPDSYKKRKDLRNLETYSVDPATARDFDQALSYTKKEDGSYILWVHIADVSHYVTPGSNLDEYAKQRATSVYLPSRGLPMHPPALSTGLCALQQDVDRFSLTCELHYDPEGNRTKVDIYESVVHVDGNLSYEFVDEKLEQNDPYWTGMLELGDLLRSKFIGLHIETKEARLSSTGVGQLGFKVEEATPSTSMNEIFMIRANEAIAEFIRDSGQPGLYRSHPIPDKPDVEKFNDQMAALGIDYEVEIPERPQSFLNLNEESSEAEVLEDDTSILDMLKSGGKMTLMAGGITTKKKKSDKKSTSKKNVEEDKETEKERKKPLMFGLAHLSDEELDKWMQPFREVLEEVRNVEEESDRMVMMLTILGMFGRAYYTQDNVGHFGLGSKCYTHFTAPIRRYSDIIVHRILKGLIRGISSIENPVYSEEDLDQLSDYITDQSYDAETLERRVVGAGLAMMTRRPEWSKDLIGVVTRVSPRYISVIIKEVLDGRIRTRDLSKQEIIVDPSESIAFIKRDEQRTIQKILSSSDWQELLDDDNEPIEVLIRLGDKKSVKIIGRDYIEGKVSVVLS
jgi:exoribonuclease R